MCSLNNAINLYREEEKEDNKCFMIVKKTGSVNTPLKNEEGKIDYFNDRETAEIERIYHQPDHKELLKVFEI